MQYGIEKGIPAPTDGDYRGKRRLYPLHKMEMGDSFLVPIDDDKDVRKMSNSILGCGRRSRHLGKRFVVRTLKNGIRCWRIK